MQYDPILVEKCLVRRFPGFTYEEAREMRDYILNITLANGSGEYCICASPLLLSRTTASTNTATFSTHIGSRTPLVDRMAELEMPVTFACRFSSSFPGNQISLTICLD